MKASEAVELTNNVIEKKRSERRPLLEQIMPEIYLDIKGAASHGRNSVSIDAINNIGLQDDVINELQNNGFSIEAVSDGLGRVYFITVKW